MDTSVLLLFGLFFIANIKFSLGDGDSYPDVVCSQTERQALFSFKQAIKDPSNLLSPWVGEDCCTWKGVHCHNTSGRVVRLQLRGKQHDSSSQENGETHNRSKLGGTISPSLLELKYLNYLDLSLNDFGGIRIPMFLGSLDNLRYLNLSQAGFSGTIPHQLGNLSSLRYLDLSCDSFTGRLDVENLQWLSRLSSLRYLGLNYVNLTQASDHWLQVINMLPSLSELHLSSCELRNTDSLRYVNFTSLAVLDLSANKLGPSVPNWLFSLSGLVSLKLDSNHFQGPIPSALHNFTSTLRALHLSENNFNSTIPTWLYNFSSLVYLDLSFNDIQGTISVDIGNLTSIANLDLSYCNLEGGIPRTFGGLCNLRTLSLVGNKLKGEISGLLQGSSQCIASCLESLNLGNNQLSGPLPDQLLGQHKNLTFLYLNYNSFSGPIPKSLGSLSKLEKLYISNNPFEGVVSEIHFTNLTKLEHLEMDSTSLVLQVSSDWIPPFQLKLLYMGSIKIAPQFPAWLRTQKDFVDLDLSNTGIADSIPTWFWKLSSQFLYLNLSHNQINGDLPKFFKLDESPGATIYLQSNHFEGPLPRLSPNVKELDLSNNSLSGQLSDFLCNSVNGTNMLRLLDLSENLLSGELPDCWMYWPSLVRINLGTNKLTGNIPSSMGSLHVLQSLHLRNNGLSGKLPSSLENCTKLITIDLGENGFSGVIPTWVGKNLSNLLVLRLHSNNFNSGIPPELCHLTSLQMLDLAHNNLSGIIPRCFGNLNAMATKQSSIELISYSLYDGQYIEKALLVMKGMQLEYSNTLTLVTTMDLSSNRLSGVIPEELTNLLGLRFLNLSENCLTGKIPEKIGVMGLLESIDFSVNNLSSVIPQSMANLSFLAHLNLSYNNLSGRIPSSTQLQSFVESSYIGNQGLCGPPLNKSCTRDEASQSPDDGDGVQEDKDSAWLDMESFFASMAMGIAVGFGGVLGVLGFKKKWRVAYFQFIDDVNEKLCTLF